MLTLIEAIIFFFLLILTIYGFFRPLYFRYRLIKLGLPENRSNNPIKRFIDAVTSFFFLRCSVKKERVYTGLIHVFILYGSLTFDTISINHILEGFKKDFRLFGHGQLGMIHSLAVDIFAILVLVAVLYFIVKRYIFRPKSYTYTTLESVYIYALLITVTVTFLIYEGAVISLNPLHAQWSFLGKVVAGWLPASEFLIKLFWWIHIINVFIFILYVPRSKYLHMIAGPINIFLKDQKPKGIVKPIDIENAENFGVATYSHFTWKDLLDGFACVDCGRCEDYCPASTTEKALNPKNLIIHLRDGLLKEGKAALKEQNKEMEPVMDRIFTDEEIWACTTCGSCMQVCPVQNEHVRKIVGLRQGRVLMEAKFPTELKNTFKGMSTQANPWGMGTDKRMDWATDLDVPLITEKPDVEYLLFLGCAAAFDDRAQKMTRALIKFLNKSNVSYAVLGENEQCCGETARRLGEEGIGQTLTNMNIELFKELKIKKILTPCPHCFNTFKNEYPDFGFDIEVIHHSQLISELIQSKQIEPGKNVNERVVIHDSCYLGRMNNIYQPQRNILTNIPQLDMVEHKKTKDHGFCCGAGGGMFWVEENEPRINHERLNQLLEVNPSCIATSCPYCLKMLDDAVKDLEKENISVKDLVEILDSE